MVTDNPNTAKSTATAPKVETKAVTKVLVKTPVKAAPKAAAKPVAKPVALPAAKSKPTTRAKPTPKPLESKTVARDAKDAKTKKPKMVRDSFTFPKAEYVVLDALKLRAAKLGSPAKKTELLRAGVKAIAAMQDDAFLAALKVVPSLKTGRPAKA
jgi:hypothetical protein